MSDSASVFSVNEDWRKWVELKVRITGLPAVVGTLSLYQLFGGHGNIIKIELEEDRNAKRTGAATVVFCPPPREAIWLRQHAVMLDNDPFKRPYLLQLSLEARTRTFEHSSPVSKHRKYRERLDISTARSLSFGLMLEQNKMMIMQHVDCSSGNIALSLNLLRRQIEIIFMMPSNIVLTSDTRKTMETFKIEILLRQMSEWWKFDCASKEVVLIIPLQSPPNIYRQTKSIQSCHDGGRYWHERSTWLRQTDIVNNVDCLRKAPVMLRKDDPIIDIGRWTTYEIKFKSSDVSTELFNVFQQALLDYNIPITKLNDFEVVAKKSETVWSWIDVPRTIDSRSWLYNDNVSILPFALRYQLEVCISQGYLNPYTMTKDFVSRLLISPCALARLELVATSKFVCFDSMEIFELALPPSLPTKLPHHCTRLLNAVVTPSTIYYDTPAVEMNNRVIRRYQEYSDRFLRVRFSDERAHGRIFSSDDHTQNAVFTRVKRCLTNGITIGDRHFEFLAFGNSQFRDQGAYFFAPTPQLGPADIRAWMGNFEEIKEISKYTARLGQCFSTTRAINSSKVDIVPIKDVRSRLNSSYTFTDGVGKISKFLASMIANELRLPNASRDPPSVFQFRLGGNKGILAVCADAKSREVHLRPSQCKFTADSKGLDIIRYSVYASATLNRQMITILRARGICDKVFLDRQQVMLANYDRSLHDKDLALNMLRRHVDQNQMTLQLASMIDDGFFEAKDPFVLSLMNLWRAQGSKMLKDKAAIVIDKSAFVLGCTDETKTLYGHHETDAQLWSDDEAYHSARLPEIFVQLSDFGNKGNYCIIKGVCLVGRNPSLHPGDLRVVLAVDNPALHHIKNAVVFPQTGDRDLPSMCSGGDLDGDDYFVIWDEAFIPARCQWGFPAAEYDSAKATNIDRSVTVDDMTTFFVNYMKNDQLGRIANAHLANADYLEIGANHPRCLELAQLHSYAVDYPKSGIPAKMSRLLHPPKYPHFMESKTRPKDKIYHSKTILGQLFDLVERIDFQPLLNLPFDKRVLDACIPTTEHLECASLLKCQYDAAMRRLMAQREIETEFEVWSTFVLKHVKVGSDYKFHEEIGRLSNALKENYEVLCHERAGGSTFDTIAPFVVAMYKVTAAEVQAVVEKHSIRSSQTLESLSSKDMPFLSFPWIFQKELGLIASGSHFPSRTCKGSSAVNSIDNVYDLAVARDANTSSDINSARATDTADNTECCKQLTPDTSASVSFDIEDDGSWEAALPAPESQSHHAGRGFDATKASLEQEISHAANMPYEADDEDPPVPTEQSSHDVNDDHDINNDNEDNGDDSGNNDDDDYDDDDVSVNSLQGRCAEDVSSGMAELDLLMSL